MEVKWNDGINQEFTEDLSVNPSSGSGNKTVTVSGQENTKLDREALIDVQTNTGGKKATVKVSQKGKRQAFCTGDGTPFLTGDSASYNVIPPDRIVFDKSISDPANITGYGTPGIMDLCSKWRRCLVKTTTVAGSALGEVAICYLKDDDSNFYHDGTPAILTGSHGDVMVYQPDIYYKHQLIDDNKFGYNISGIPLDEYKKFDESLIGAYKAVDMASGGSSSSSRTLRSVSGVIPTVDKTITQFRSAAYSGGGSSMNVGWDIIDYHQHCVIALMFYAKYGTRDSRAVLGRGGALYNSNNTTGSTNKLGNMDTQKESSNYINFLGVEGVHGGLYEFVSGSTIKKEVWIILNPDGTTREVAACPEDGWISEIAASEGPFFDLVPTQVDGVSSYTDYYYAGTSIYGDYNLARSDYSNGGGIAFAHGNFTINMYSEYFGSRLAFRGKINVIDDPAEFISLPVRL